MMDLLTALGLMFALEGALYALFPDGMRQVMLRVIGMSAQHLRIGGIFMAAFGFVIVAVLKGY